MTVLLFANNANSTLALALTNSATSAVLATGTGALFPAPAAGQAFLLTLRDAATGALNEIVLVTARSGDVVTITRAQEGTTAKNWLAGDPASNFLTAGTQAAFVQADTFKTEEFLTAGGTTPSGTAYPAGGPYPLSAVPRKIVNVFGDAGRQRFQDFSLAGNSLAVPGSQSYFQTVACTFI